MKKTTGISVPLISLRKKAGSLCGEFSDLIGFAKFCKRISVDIIQILPVNDTGEDASPYGALSAFALHPIYLDITLLSLSPVLQQEYQSLLAKYQDQKRIKFIEVLQAKMALVRKFYNEENLDNEEMAKWQQEHSWVETYALFKVLKDKHHLKSWANWDKQFQNPTQAKIAKWSKQFQKEMRFYIWLQFELFSQFKHASQAVKKEGIALKGDLPILMNEDSADVWLHRTLFSLELRAGAPPDMFSTTGQNWGFPIYNWHEHKKQNYSWWRLRFSIAENFYEYIRIDHVLGFFRIWNIPSYENTGLSGYFSPFPFLGKKDLADLGFSSERISWLSNAHIPKDEILQIDPTFTAPWIQDFFVQIGNEPLFLFKESINEKTILQADISGIVQQAMLSWYHNRALIQVDDQHFFPHWQLENSRAFASLHDIEKEVFLRLVKERYKEGEQIWEDLGKEILSSLQKGNSLFLCAEDLGAVPACVPKVMQELSIYGLRIERWSRHYHEDSSFYLPKQYPSETVFTVSVHDTSTLREWWQKETQDSQTFYYSLDEKMTNGKEFSTNLSTNLHFSILRRGVEEVNSKIVVFQFQELLDLGHSLKSKGPQNDRINIPGTIDEQNWSYRLPASIEQLSEETTWVKTLQELFATK